MKLLQKEYKANPKNSWNSWFLANEYYRNQDLENFVIVGLDFIANANRHGDGKWNEVCSALNQIKNATNVPDEIRAKIKNKFYILGLF